MLERYRNVDVEMSSIFPKIIIITNDAIFLASGIYLVGNSQNEIAPFFF